MITLSEFEGHFCFLKSL